MRAQKIISFSERQDRFYQQMPHPMPHVDHVPRKVPQLGLLSKQALLLVLKSKLSALSRHMRRFDAAIALRRAQEAKNKSNSYGLERSSAESSSIRKKYEEVVACQARHEAITKRRAKRRAQLGRDPKFITPSVPKQLLRKAWTRPLAPVPKMEEEDLPELDNRGGKRPRISNGISHSMFGSESPPNTSLHVPTVVFSTILMEMREGPRSPAMLLTTLVRNLPGGPRMAKQLLRKIDSTFAVLSGIGLIKPFVPPKYMDSAVDSRRHNDGSAALASVSADPAVRSSDAAGNMKGYNMMSLFVLDKQQDTMLGNVDLFTHRLFTIKHRLFKQQKLEQKLLAELKKDYGITVDLNAVVTGERRGISDGKQYPGREAKRMQNTILSAAAAVPTGTAWDITFPDPMTLFTDTSESIKAQQGDSDKDDKSRESDQAKLSMPPASMSLWNKNGSSLHPFSSASLQTYASNVSTVGLAERAATNYDDVDRMRAILSHLKKSANGISSRKTSRMNAKTNISSSEQASANKHLKSKSILSQAPCLLPPTPGVVLELGVGFLPTKNQMIQAQNAAFTSHASGRGRKGQLLRRPALLDGSPATQVEKYAEYPVAEALEMKDSSLIPWSSIVQNFAHVTASDMSSLAAVVGQSSSSSGRSESVMAALRRKPTTVPIPRWNLVEELENGKVEGVSLGNPEIEEDDSTLLDSVLEMRHREHLGSMQSAFEKAKALQEKKKRERIAARQNTAMLNRSNRSAALSPRHNASPRAGSSRKRRRVVSEIGLPASSLSNRASKSASSKKNQRKSGAVVQQQSVRQTRLTRRSALAAAAASATSESAQSNSRSKRKR